MTLAPVRMINDNDREMNVYDLGECAQKRNANSVKDTQNFQNSQGVIDTCYRH